MSTISSPVSSASLSQDDVRAIVRLLSQLSPNSEDWLNTKKTFMQSLAELTNSDYWIWNIMRFTEDKPPIALATVHNFPEDLFTALVASNYELPQDEMKLEIKKLSLAQKHWTRTRSELISDDKFEQTPLFQKYIQNTGLSSALLTGYPLKHDPTIISGMSLHRTHDKPAFTQRESLILHIITAEIDWLHNIEKPQNEELKKLQLTPRLQTVFYLLMDGLAPKRIAHHLNLSEHSVRSYIQLIYKHFGVSSRLQLTNRFTQGDGNHISK